jgi:hypothetical protein
MFELIRQDLKAYRNARGMIQWNEPSIFCVLFYRIGHAIELDTESQTGESTYLFLR